MNDLYEPESEAKAILLIQGKKIQVGIKQNSEYMIERENKSTTYIGNSVAIPHGTLEGKAQVIKTGIVINQYPNGVDFGNGNKAYFLIGIAGKNNEHVDLIANIADIIEDEDRVLELAKVTDREEIFRVFSL